MITKIIFLIFLIEIFLIFTINFFKKDFQWLLTEKDQFPIHDEKKLKNFLNKKFSKKLGWEYEKGISGSEVANHRKTFYNITLKGYRKDTNNYKHSKISVFGDSFAFCRYVNDDKTWQNFLGKKLKTNVRNYGVGNYGLDQSFLKLKYAKLDSKTKLIIFNFVPHTMERLYSYWRHYSEFGNIHGFKPIFILKNNKLYLKKNILEKHFKIKDIKSKIELIKKHDIFYKTRFSKRIFRFPFTLTFLKNFKLYSKVLFWLSLDFLNKYAKVESKNFKLKAQQEIVKKNLYDVNMMYKDKKYTNLITKLIGEIKKDVEKKNKKIIFLITPTIIDINIYKKNIKHQVNFFSKLNNKDLINLTHDLSKIKKFSKFFIDDKYAGHLSVSGNKFVAKKLFEHINRKKYL